MVYIGWDDFNPGDNMQYPGDEITHESDEHTEQLDDTNSTPVHKKHDGKKLKVICISIDNLFCVSSQEKD